jgi:hypothetical protein
VVRYNVKPDDQVVQQISLSFDSFHRLIGSVIRTSYSTTSSHRFEKKQISNNENCEILSIYRLMKIIIKNKKYKDRNAKNKCINDSIDFNDIYLTEHGLTYQYDYEPKAKNKTCIGEVLINIHLDL